MSTSIALMVAAYAQKAALKGVRQCTHHVVETAAGLKKTAVKAALMQCMHWAHQGLDVGQDYSIAQENGYLCHLQAAHVNSVLGNAEGD